MNYLFNLITLSDESSLKAHQEALAQKINHRLPCRMLFLDLMNNLDTLEKKAEGSSVRFCAGQQSARYLPLAALHELASDVPIMLLTTQKLLSSSVIHTLAPLSSRLLFHPMHHEPLSKSFQTLSKLHQRFPKPLIDIDWAQCGSWRSLVRTLFNEVEGESTISTARLIQITYQGTVDAPFPENANRALYLAGYLMVREGWRRPEWEIKGETITIIAHRDHETLTIHLYAVDTQNAPLEEILSLEIVSEDGTSTLITRGDQCQVHVHVSKAETCDMPFALLLPSFQTSLTHMRGLLYSSPSPEYYHVLEVLGWEP